MSYQGNNPEGYPDPTAIRAIAGAYGLTIENRITFKDKETEEIFR